MTTKSFTPISSIIDDVSYDMDSHILTVIFNGGGEYRYADVPYPVYLGLEAAPSVGSYFHAHVKNKFSFEKIS